MKKQNPAGMSRQGFGISFSRKSVDTAVPLENQSDFAPIAWLAARARVNISTARLFAELHRFGEVRS